MAHDQHGAGKVRERPLHHLGALHVEVVGGLVEHDRRRSREKALGERHPCGLAAGEIADLGRTVQLGELKEAEEPSDRLLGGVKGQAVRHGGDGVADGVVEVEFIDHLVERDVVGAAGPVDLSAGGRRSGEGVEQGGFATAVGAEDRYPVAAVDIEAEALEQAAAVEGHPKAGHFAQPVLHVQTGVDLGHDPIDGAG